MKGLGFPQGSHQGCQIQVSMSTCLIWREAEQHSEQLVLLLQTPPCYRRRSFEADFMRVENSFAQVGQYG